ncbi:MAG: hypothetical protein IAE78_27380 [Myxococcus sp.]|nr:hypothetical protein [Myxococcus sp.]
MVRFGSSLLMFGGRTGSNSYLNDLWRFDGSTWTSVTSATRPAARGHHVMGVLRINNVDRLFLFGGQATGNSFNDTWEWTGTDWVQLSPTMTPASGAPAANGGGFSMAQEAFGSKLIMVGGWNDQLWEFDGQAWVGRRPATRPSSRVYPAVAVVGTKVVVFGGFNTSNTEVGDTWEWDGATWLQRTVTPAPRARRESVAITRAGRAFLHAGMLTRSSISIGLSDTWEWDGSTWQDVDPTPAPRPEGRSGHAIATHGNELVLFGGKNELGTLNDETWRWSAGAWQRLSPTTRPSPREHHAMASVGGRVLLFGGRSGTTSLSDTWEWNGTDWELKAPAASPPGRAGHGLAVSGSNVVLFGGANGATVLGDTWLWNGTTWTQLAPATSPSARQLHGMGSLLGTPVVFAGIVDPNDPLTALNDVWEWTGTTWQLKTPATPVFGLYDSVVAVEVPTGLLFVPGRTHSSGSPNGRLWWGTDFSQVYFSAQSPQSSYVSRHSAAIGAVPGGALLIGGGSQALDSNAVASDSWFFALPVPDAGTADAGVDGGAPAQDAGTPAQDAGTPPQDAGTPAQDAGMPAQDAGVPEQDAGMPAQDAGTPTQDAGTPTQDAGTPTQDAGTPTQDAGTPTQDAGTPTQDAGTPTQDAGTPTQDAGTPTQDAGTPTQDAGTPTQDAGAPTQDAGTGNSPMGPGCSCTGTPDGAWLFVSLLGQIFWARRRRSTGLGVVGCQGRRCTQPRPGRRGLLAHLPIATRSQMARRRFLLIGLFGLSAASCSSSPELQPVPFTTFGRVWGTAADDLWTYWEGPKTGELLDPHLEHSDGATVRPVALPELFKEGTCGTPSQFLTGRKGELWLGAIRNPACGARGLPAADRFLFGVLRPDGAFVERSGDFPTEAPDTYRDARLYGRGGVVMLVVVTQQQGGSAPIVYRLYRYTAEGRVELPLPSGYAGGEIRVLSSEDFYVFGGTGRALGHFRDGAYQPVVEPVSPADILVSLNGETWWWNENMPRVQEQFVQRYNGSEFERVNLNFPEVGDRFFMLGLVPHGNGQFSVVGVRRGTTTSNATSLSVLTRRFSGDRFGPESLLGRPVACADNSSRECADLLSAEKGVTLDDGTIVVRTLSGAGPSLPARHLLISTKNLP